MIFAAIRARVQQAAETCDLVLLNAGSSAGSEDFSARVVESLGELLVHGIAVRPGHPVILGMVERPGGGRVPVIGVPGYPVSAALTVEIFVEELLARWLGRRPVEPPVLSRANHPQNRLPPGDDDYVRVVVGKVGEKTLAAPLSRGAGVITSLVRADGLVVLPRGVQGVEAGETVRVQLLRPLGDIERTIFCIGSHDVLLDLLAQFLSEHDRRLVSANVGSQGGLVALRRGESALWLARTCDPETGEYNLPYLARYLPGVPVKVVGFVRREQGLLVRRGNPRQIQPLRDRPGRMSPSSTVSAGSGTRILLDYHLNQLGLAPEQTSRLRERRIHPSGRGGGSGLRPRRLRAGHSGSRAGAPARFRAALPRTLRPGHPQNPRRKQPAAPPAGRAGIAIIPECCKRASGI